MAFNNSEIVLNNPETNTSAKIVLEYSGTDDITVPLTAKPGMKLSKERLELYKSNLNNFKTNGGKIISNPTVSSFYQEDGVVKATISKYSSPLLIPLSIIQYQIATDTMFANVVSNVKKPAITNENNYIEFSTDTLTPGSNYYFRMRYGGGCDWSEWTEYKGFIVSRPTLDKPVIDPNVSYVYKESIPYDVSITFNATPASGVNHDSSTWRIYEKRNNELVEIWSKVKSAVDLTSLTISSMFPNVLHYNTEYFITLTTYSSNINTEYSYESDPVPFCASSVTVRAPSNLTVYPAVVNVANPILGFDENIFVILNGKEKLLDYSNIEKIYWEITSDSGKITHMSTTFTINLPAGSLLPGKTYKVRSWYYHKYLGESDKAELTFTTAKEFVAFRDNLLYPIKTSDGIAYYGDIPTSELMNESVRYAGIFTNTKSYDVYDEVNYNGELYICKRRTPATGYTLSEYFIKADSSDAHSYYKSGLPTFQWLIENIGLNPNLCTTDVMSGNTNVLHNDISGWFKCQNVYNKIIYITKTPIYNGVSVNDLIKADLFHPKRKTIRIADSLYYVRLLCTKMNVGYDALDPVSDKDSLNFDYGSEVIDYKEDNIITCLLNGKLAAFTTTDLDVSTTENKELVYDCEKLSAYKIDTQSGMVYLGRDFNSPDDRRYSIRLVLEYIPESDRPIMNISPRIPGPGINIKEDGTIENYDKFLDFCYLGSVDVTDFLSSLAINEKSGLHADTPTPNRLWHKYYYKGMIYFMSQGINISQVGITELEKANIMYPTPLYVLQDGSEDAVNGKIVFNNVIYNVCLPKALNYDYQQVIIKNSKNMPYDILTPGTTNTDITIGFNSFISDCVYPIYINQLTSADDPRQIPFTGAKGYKGKYKTNDSLNRVIDNLGSCSKTDYEASFITGQKFMKSGGTEHYVMNGQRDPYIMLEHNGTSDVDVLFCLTVNPTIDCSKIWKK